MEDADSKYRVFAKRLIMEELYPNFEEAFSAAKELDLEDTNETYQAAIGNLNDNLRDAMVHSGVTCFTSRRNDQRMWGTYGDNHAGAVLSFQH